MRFFAPILFALFVSTVSVRGQVILPFAAVADDEASPKERAEVSAAKADLARSQQKIRLEAENLADKWRVLAQKQATGPTGARALVNTFKPFSPTERAAFLGIAVSSVPAVLKEQLGLPNGVGLVAEHVDAKSPAEAAGVKQYDVLHKLGDQLLINPSQFAVLVRTHKPGDEIRLTLIRRAQSMQVMIKAAEKELPVLPEELTALPLVGRLFGDKDAKNWDGGMTRVYTPAGETAALADKNVVVWVQTENGGRTILGLDSTTGKTLFKGPIDTEEQRRNLPKDAAEKLKELDTSRVNEPAKIKPHPPIAAAPKAAPQPPRQSPVAPEPPPAPKGQDQRSIVYSEDGYSFQVSVGPGKKSTLRITDPAGTVIYVGPTENALANEAIPAPLRERLNSPAWRSMIQEMESPKPVGR